MARFTDCMEETQSELRQNESHRDLRTQTLRKSLPVGYKVQTGLCTFKTPYVMGKGIKPQQRKPESLGFSQISGQEVINKLLLKSISRQSFHPLRRITTPWKVFLAKAEYWWLALPQWLTVAADLAGYLMREAWIQGTQNTVWPSAWCTFLIYEALSYFLKLTLKEVQYEQVLVQRTNPWEETGTNSL